MKTRWAKPICIVTEGFPSFIPVKSNFSPRKVYVSRIDRVYLRGCGVRLELAARVENRKITVVFL